MTDHQNIPTGTYADPKYILGLDHPERKETAQKGWEALETLREEKICDTEYQEAKYALKNAIAARSNEIFEKMYAAGIAVEQEAGLGTLRTAPDLDSISLAVDKGEWNNYDALNYAHNRIRELEEQDLLGPSKPLEGSAVSDVESEFASTGAIWDNMTDYLEQ